MIKSRVRKTLVLLLLALAVGSCQPASVATVTPMNAPIIVDSSPTPTLDRIDLTIDPHYPDLAKWKTRCSNITTARPFADLAEIAPFKAVVLSLDPKSGQWEANRVFPSLINTAGEPEYLVCVFRTWTSVTSYSTDRGNVPGYREDWRITVQVLDTQEVYTTPTLAGEDPPYTVSYQTDKPLTEIVGDWPWDEARALLLSKQSRSGVAAELSIPYGYDSFDFAPDNRSLYVPFEDGFYKWDFLANTRAPLSFQVAPANCEKGRREIRASFDGKYLATTCHTPDGKSATEIWAADTLERTAGFVESIADSAYYQIGRQFELQEQKRIVAVAYATHGTAVTTLDLSTGEVQSTPLNLEGQIRWVSPEAKYAITLKDDNQTHEIWDLAGHRILNSFVIDSEEDQVSRDGRLLFSIHRQGDTFIQVRNMQTMQPLLKVVAEAYSEMEVSPNGRLLAVLSDHKVDIIDVQARSLIETIPSPGPLLFSPDGRFAVRVVGSDLPETFQFPRGVVVVISTGLP